MFTPEQKAALTAPLSSAHVKKNPKGFDYVEGWHAIAEANRIFGHDGWDRETNVTMLGQPEMVGDKWRIRFMGKVRIVVAAGDQEVVREGIGFGSGIAKDQGDAFEGAIKEAETDAMKRALMTFGNPFGLALYDKAKAEVVQEQRTAEQPKPNLAVVAAQTAITMAHNRADLKAWHEANAAMFDMLTPDEHNAIARSYKERWNALAPAKEAA
jgi:DNA repair and recombination protein RAD52